MARININVRTNRNPKISTGSTGPINPGRAPAPVSFSAARSIRLQRPTTGGQFVHQQAPEAILPVDPKAVQEFTDALHERAIKIQDEKNTQEARTHLINFKEQIRDLGYGDKGFFLTEGRETVLGREAVNEKLEGLIKETLEEVSPAVREKMAPQVLASQESFITQAAKYSRTQNKKWQQDLAEHEEIQFDKDLQISAPDVENNYLAIVNRAFELNPDYPDGTISQISREKREMYVAEKAKVQMESLGETAGVEGMAKVLDFYKTKLDKVGYGSLLKVFENGLDKERTRIEKQEKAQEKALKSFQENNEDSIFVEQLESGNILTKQDIANLVKTKKVSSSWAKKYINENYKKQKQDKSVLLAYEDELLSSDNPEEILKEAEKDESVSLAEIRRLRRLNSNSVSSQFKNDLKIGKQEIEIITAEDEALKGFFRKESEQNKMWANQELQERLENKESLNSILSDIRNRYSNTGLPALLNNERPKDVNSVRTFIGKLKNQLQSGTITQDLYNQQMRIVQVYVEEINNGSRKSNTR